MVLSSVSVNGTGDSRELRGIWNKGILCRIQGGIWSMEARLDPGDINMRGEELPDFVRLGSKRLLPSEVKHDFLNTIGRARNAADRYGFPFFIGGTSFIPFENFDLLKEAIEKERTTFFEHVDKFISRYEDHRNAYLEAYPQHAGSLAMHYPDVDFVRSKFKFETIYYAANIGSVMGADGTAEDMYLSWAVNSMNTLRAEARQIADRIIEADANGGKIDGRNMRPVQGLRDRVSAMDLLEDPDLKRAILALSVSPPEGMKEYAKELKDAAVDVNPLFVRRILID
ncbi:MAG: hypothetical protein CMB80_03180 [Flammeovirgaceae bacterium]|jgi:hypothetical protein|nr:hypothetical protein [Flammeovirgaceae bacterium]